MKIVSAEQMREIDRKCIELLGIPSLALMERAGEAVADQALEMLYATPGPVVVLCGKGNNGGDGLVAARLLYEANHEVHVVLPFARESLSPDADAEYQRAVEIGVPITPTVTDDALAGAALIIDALLGTGVTGPVSGIIGELLKRTNRLRGGKGVLAVDLPSGINADTGAIAGPAMSAEVTVTMGLPKPGLLFFPGALLAGQWLVADIGFPPELLELTDGIAEVVERKQAAEWLPRRSPAAHKRSAGYALIIAGSFGMTGAAAMAATAAYRSGAGLVRLALPTSLVQVLNAQLTEVVFRPLPETSAGTLGFQAVKLLLTEADEVQATLIGPGLSRNAATQHAVRRLIAQWPGTLVVDADALTAAAGHDDVWQARTAPTVITPHPGEMSRLLGLPIAELEQDRLTTAKAAARRYNAITVYKGAPTVIAAPDGRAYIVSAGQAHAGLAVAGTGDTLAGCITALLAQGVAPFEAATLATYLGGLAAEILTADLGTHGMTALDLIDGLPYALKQLGG